MIATSTHVLGQCCSNIYNQHFKKTRTQSLGTPSINSTELTSKRVKLRLFLINCMFQIWCQHIMSHEMPRNWFNSQKEGTVSAFDMLLLCCFQLDMVVFDVLQIITLYTPIFNKSPLGFCKKKKKKTRRKTLNLGTDLNKGRDTE